MKRLKIELLHCPVHCPEIKIYSNGDSKVNLSKKQTNE